jgi:hypothetical protein
VPGDIANIFNSGTYLRANLVGDHRVDNPTPERWINTSAFGAPDQFTFGNLGRNSLRALTSAELKCCLILLERFLRVSLKQVATPLYLLLYLLLCG